VTMKMQRNYIKTEFTKGQEKLNFIKIEKTNTLNKIIREIKELNCKHNIHEQHLIYIKKQNSSLQ